MGILEREAIKGMGGIKGNPTERITEAFKPISFAGKTVITGATSYKSVPDVGGELVVYLFGEANTEYGISHHRNRIPVSVSLQSGGNGGIIYKGDTAWTRNKVYVKSTTANNEVTLLIT